MRSYGDSLQGENEQSGNRRPVPTGFCRKVNVIGNKFRILVFPHHGYWSKDGGIYEDKENNDMAIIQLEKLIAPGTYDWGHIAMEAKKVPSEFSGQGINRNRLCGSLHRRHHR